MSDINDWMERIEAFREDHAAHTATNKERFKQFSVDKRRALYADLQEAYCLLLDIRSDAARPVLNSLLKEHGIITRKGTNPWMPLTNLLFGKWQTEKKSGLKSWKPDRASKKYAPCFQLFEEVVNDPETVANFIEKFTHPKYGNRLIGIERFSRSKSRGEIAFMQEGDWIVDVRRNFLVECFAEAGPLATIANLAANHKRLAIGGVNVRLWGSCEDGSVIKVYGLMDTGHVDLNSHLDKVAKELFTYIDKTKVTGPKGHSKAKVVPALTPTAVRLVALAKIDKLLWRAKKEPGSEESEDALSDLHLMGLWPKVKPKADKAKPTKSRPQKSIKVTKGSQVEVEPLVEEPAEA